MSRRARWVGFALLTAVVAAVAGLPGCSPDEPWKGQGGPPRVVVSFPPLYCFVKNVAGDDAGVLTLCSTQGPHDYHYNAYDTAKVRRADLFLINGLNLDEHFTTKIKNNCGNPNLKLVEVAEAIPLDKLRKYTAAEQSGHVHGEHDPHVWLGIDEAILMVSKVRDELKAKDPARAAKYDERAGKYIAKLKDLQDRGKKALKDKKNRNLVTTHDALHYFAACFDLTIVGRISAAPGSSAGFEQIKRLVDLGKDPKTLYRVIATEPQYSTGDAKALLQALHDKGVKEVELVEVDPLETASLEDLKDPEWYEKKMQQNLDALQKALQ